jgi:hypothetical protein
MLTSGSIHADLLPACCILIDLRENIVGTVKGKAIPLQTWTGPDGSVTYKNTYEIYQKCPNQFYFT